MNKENLKQAIVSGKIFIYPTDTIYGIGCNAMKKRGVAKIRRIKQRDKKPFSVIIPSLKWIKENCIINVELEKYLPGPYTVILKKKNPKFLNWVSDTNSLGVRIPDCYFTKFIQEAGVPFITTSVNLAGKPPINNLEEVPTEILNKIDLIVTGRNLTGKPSTLIINGKEARR